jgi:hypothetical protein
MELGEKFDYDLIKIIKHLITAPDEESKPIIKESRYQTIKKKYAPYVRIYEQNSKSEDFANWYYENTLLGYTYNRSLKDIYSSKRSDLEYIREVNDKRVNAPVVFIGKVRDIYLGVSKKKTKYFRCEVEDHTGTLTALLFKEKIDECKNLNSGMPEKNNIVIVKGSKKEDCVFASLIAVQDNEIYTKLSQIKNIDK